MWQTFQGALERKVKLNNKQNKKKEQRIDKYIIEKAFRDVLLEQFGQIGLTCINLEVETNSKIKVKCKSSVWKSEMRMRKASLIKEINTKIGDEIVFGFIIT